ncbi:unnamed protein product [Durusdinium trenchii]|uniref:Uncharacterized protein n=1 Tax=Durusdinium trenchii TaxID=1381693 RepID=A0ABP0J346_9DINO
MGNLFGAQCTACKLHEASEEEVKKSTRCTAAKAKAKARARTSSPKKKTPAENKDTPFKENKRCAKPKPPNPESTPETTSTPPPAPAKRMRGKHADPDADSQILALKEANKRMQARLAEFENKATAKSSSPAPAPKKPSQPRSSAAKSKAAASKSKPVEMPEPDEVGSESENEMTDAAKNNRLRRLCERKPSGRLRVPEKVHKMWLAKGHSREKLRQMLEDCDWDSERFIRTVTKSHETVSKKSKKTRRGWYTKEGMEKVLKWSKKYIASVVKYCEKKGLVKKDKYNKKLMKYHVEIEEGDESLDEEIDRVHEEECEEAFSPHPKPLPSKCF